MELTKVSKEVEETIDRLIREHPAHGNPQTPEVAAWWDELFTHPPTAAAVSGSTEDNPASTSVQARPAAPAPPPKRLPKAGTRVQRSDSTNNRKLAGLMTTPPPLHVPAEKPRIREDRMLTAEEIRRLQLHRRPKLRIRPATTVVAALQAVSSSPKEKTSPVKTPGKKEAGENNLTPQLPATTSAKATRKTRAGSPPPLLIEVRPGTTVVVPYRAATISRRYKARTPQGRWMLRFTSRGELRAARPLPGGGKV